ncbi:MAG TPA: hypothetical protein PKI12_01510 [Bacteroidales bacterium]|nr:hypothetical protein [Bacteroidales bacterium]
MENGKMQVAIVKEGMVKVCSVKSISVIFELMNLVFLSLSLKNEQTDNIHPVNSNEIIRLLHSSK